MICFFYEFIDGFVFSAQPGGRIPHFAVQVQLVRIVRFQFQYLYGGYRRQCTIRHRAQVGTVLMFPPEEILRQIVHTDIRQGRKLPFRFHKQTAALAEPRHMVAAQSLVVGQVQIGLARPVKTPVGKGVFSALHIADGGVEQPFQVWRRHLRSICGNSLHGTISF